MEKGFGDQTRAKFGPEWLKDSSTTTFFPVDDDQSVARLTGSPATRKLFYPANANSTKSSSSLVSSDSSASPRILVFARSKSSPLLLDNPQIKNGVFKMLKERNSFEKNFPTLNGNPKKGILKSTTQVLPKEKETAWGQSPVETIATKISPTSNTPTPQAEQRMEEKDREIQLDMQKELRVPVPVPTILSASKDMKRNRVELVVPKKSSKADIKKRFDPALLRKASSEPNLPIVPGYAESYAKLRAAQANQKLLAQAITEEKHKAATASVSTRNDFIEGLRKKEEQKMKMQAGNNDSSQAQATPITNGGSANGSANGSPTNGDFVQNIELANGKEELGQNHQNHSRSRSLGSLPIEGFSITKSSSPLVSSEEDEERFLRNLGWVPEEEAHVPELSEEEILQFKSHVLPSKRRACPDRKHLDMSSIRKWQHNRFAVRVLTSDA